MATKTKFHHLSKLKRLRNTEQVAAVCYRKKDTEIQFLLVQTGGGRWIFPKGGVEPGLTHAQAAAIEAYEEAGVHGRMEEAAFTRYSVCRRNKQSVTRQSVSAHLCEVLRLGPPQETGRKRTWFSPEEARKVLREDRKAEDGAELARVIVKAGVRIQKVENKPAAPIPAIPVAHRNPKKDALQRVQLEAWASEEQVGQIEALYTRYISRRRGDVQRWADKDFGAAVFLRKAELGGAIATVTSIDRGSHQGRARKQ